MAGKKEMNRPFVDMTAVSNHYILAAKVLAALLNAGLTREYEEFIERARTVPGMNGMVQLARAYVVLKEHL